MNECYNKYWERRLLIYINIGHPQSFRFRQCPGFKILTWWIETFFPPIGLKRLMEYLIKSPSGRFGFFFLNVCLSCTISTITISYSLVRWTFRECHHQTALHKGCRSHCHPTTEPLRCICLLLWRASNHHIDIDLQRFKLSESAC